MIELMMDMALCLVVALIIGFVIGWLFSKALGNEEYDMDYDELSSREDEHNRQLKVLELKYEKEKRLRANEEKKGKDLKFELMKKVTLLKNTTNMLEEAKANTSSNRVNELEKLLKEKNAELVEFESVLVKAEETIEKLKKINS
ncbi:hypothetical protein MNB_SV-12-1520 [hydrothermal vent metagenome]|uniref:Uncharacterized protein n=1 Tax=hydrothermal vent metagenome TaxID=652676 RepID=A0A1W1BIG0_9ZZZZ